MNNNFSTSNDNIQAHLTLSCDDTSTQDTAEEKLFTQTELENLISERLRRERKNQQALIPIKELLGTLKEKGFIKNSSYPEMTTELCGHLSTLFDSKKEASSVGITDESENSSIEDSSNRANTQQADSGQSYVTPDESYDLPYEALPQENTQEDVQQNVQESSSESQQVQRNLNQNGVANPVSINASDIVEMYEKYPDVNIGSVLSSPAFLSFSKGKNGSLCEIYSDYLFMTNLLENDSTRALKKVTSVLGSTGFGASSRAEVSQNTHNLTARQMQIAKSAGLSYREYNELLSSIPKGPRSNHI